MNELIAENYNIAGAAHDAVMGRLLLGFTKAVNEKSVTVHGCSKRPS